MRRLRTILLVVLIVTCGFSARAEEEIDPAGRWKGSIHLPGQELEIMVDLIAGDEGWEGSIDIPEQGLAGYRLADLSLEGAVVSFRMPEIPGDPTFRGRFQAEDARIAGTFTQGEGAYPFQLERSTEPTARERALASLEGFEEWVEQAMKDWAVPGLAVAVVMGDEPLWARGFGQRDREADLPVTPETLFAVGSTTKSFTALLLGTLVDEGRLDWDEPVRTVLQDFHLQDPFAKERMNALDLLNHSSGLPRHDLTWYGAGRTRQELYRQLRHLEPSEDFRTTFQYSNLMYMTAGVLAERITGQSWEELLRTRILEPLGMQGANLSVRVSQQAEDFAQPYQENEEEELEKVPFRPIEAMGPAGAINASVTDMGRWLSLHLGGGRVGAREIVSPATLAELHRPRTVVSGPDAEPEKPLACYASGWLVEPYRGHQRFWHNGGIDGFTAQMCFLPHDNLGLVILANKGGTPLPPLVEQHALDRLLDLEPRDWSGELLEKRDVRRDRAEKAHDEEDPNRKTGTRPAHDLEEYTGEYRDPAYGEIHIRRRGRKKLHLEFHSLESELEHYHYEVFRATGEDSPLQGVRLTFRTDARGHVGNLEVALEPTVAPIVFHRRPPQRLRDPVFLERLVGEYDLQGAIATIRLRGEDTLTARVPGQPEMELIPYRGMEFDLEGLSGYSVRFLVPDQGPATSLQFLQPDGVYRGTRVEDEPNEDP